MNQNQNTSDSSPSTQAIFPTHLHLDRKQGLSITWSDGRQSFYPLAYLRRMSPSADARTLREQMQSNPLTVLPTTSSQSSPQSLTAEKMEPVGHYAVRIRFSDGHDTGLYSWVYLRQIDPQSSPFTTQSQTPPSHP